MHNAKQSALEGFGGRAARQYGYYGWAVTVRHHRFQQSPKNSMILVRAAVQVRGYYNTVKCLRSEDVRSITKTSRDINMSLAFSLIYFSTANAVFI